MQKDNISYKKIIDNILKCIPTNIDPDTLNIQKINIMFDNLRSELDINDNTLEQIKEKIIILLNKYKYSVSELCDAELTYKNKIYFENFRLYLYDYRIKLANVIRDYNEHNNEENIKFMNKTEILNYDVNNIEKFIRNCFYINYKKEPNAVFVPDNFIKMIYSYYGLENKIPHNLSEYVILRDNNIDDNTNYSPNERTYDRFIKFLVKDIKTKFLLKQKIIAENFKKLEVYYLKIFHDVYIEQLNLNITTSNELMKIYNDNTKKLYKSFKQI